VMVLTRDGGALLGASNVSEPVAATMRAGVAL
jgi:hypothetical protein